MLPDTESPVLSFQVEPLAALLKKLLAVVGKKDGLSSYRSLRIRTVAPGVVGFYAYSRLITAEGRINANSSYNFDFGVDAEIFEQVIKNLPKTKTAVISPATEYITLSVGGNSSYRFNAVSPESFAPVRSYQDIPFVEFDFEAFLTGIKRVSFCCDAAAQRVQYQAVCINSDHFVATNGFMLSLSPNTVFKTPRDVLISCKCVEQLEKLYAGVSGKGGFFCTETELNLCQGGIYSTTRLLAGHYLGYKSVLPTSMSTLATVDRTELSKKLETVLLMAPENKTIHLTVQRTLVGAELLLHAKNKNRGDALEEVPADVQGDFHKIALNGESLLAVIKNYSCEKIQLEYRGENAVFIVTNGEHVNAISPVKGADF